MATIPAPYKGQEFDDAKRQILLLHLAKGTTRHAPIVCDTTVVSLNDGNPYIALSYCWGETKEGDEAMITFNQSPNFPIGGNLEDALCHIRSTNETVTLWVDALCINQENHNEKNHQVQIMREIYRNSEQTCIWLGKAADDSDLAMDIIANLDGDNLDSPYNSIDASGLKALEKLQKRPYWTRIWVVQGNN
jgi:hypothetical protein